MSTNKDSGDAQVSKNTQYARVWIDDKGFHVEFAKGEESERT